jgi:hypothetical protein
MTEPGGLITYHQTRRGSRIIPLQSYGNTPPETKFDGLDYIDFQSKDVSNSIIERINFFLSSSSMLYQ